MNLGLREDLFNFPESIMSVVPVAPRVAFSGMGQARIENNLKHIYLKNGQVKIEGMCVRGDHI